MTRLDILIALLFFPLLFACNERKKQYVPVSAENFKTVYEGKQVDLFDLTNVNGMKVQITNFGGKIVSILVPDHQGNLGDVCMGYESFEGYRTGSGSMGATIGRFANRIGNAQFILNDSTYTLAKNNGPNSIHGGERGFRFVVWDVQEVTDHRLRLFYRSVDGEEGYPGNMDVTVTFTLTDENEIRIDYHASTDKSTVINLTNHAYFNLSGEGHHSILDHELLINAEQFTPIDQHSIPTGEYRDVENTAFDFREFRRVGDRIDGEDEQLQLVGGYDHNFVLNKPEEDLALSAILYDPLTRRVMEVFTTEPGIQIYTGNHLKGTGTDVGKGGKPYGPRSGICLETQHFPDSPNKPGFPTTVLNPEETFKSTTIYKFSVRP
jgi:aldose 1-epimerase